ncbi:MAG: MFS transporter [Variovorax sp.]|nr:MFS transporter [Variovorax sp.]
MTDVKQLSPVADADLKATLRKVLWRLMPFLVLAHAIAGIDRLNISFAKLRMAEDIVMSDAAYGLGAGVFYLGYILFEIPSNLLLQRIGARATLTRIMLLWGVITVATAFVRTPAQLVVSRFLLGVAEAGFFPGVILYLTYWFPAAFRGRVTAVFLMAGIFAGVLSGPLAGWIMTGLHGWGGFHRWQALFVLEGIPAVLLGLFAWFRLSDTPATASWLNSEERLRLASALAADSPRQASQGRLRDVLRDRRVYIAGLVYFCIYCGVNTTGYWMPTLIRGLGVEDLKTIGILTSVPFVIALVGMYVLGRSSDRRMERRWHVALPMLLSGFCFLFLGFVPQHAPLALALMSVGAAAGMCAIPLFWTIPPAFLATANAAAGIALISCMGNLAGVVSQAGVGAIKSLTGNLYVAFDAIALVLVLGAAVLLSLVPARLLQERKPIVQRRDEVGTASPMASAEVGS